jgi:AAA domain
MDEKRLQALQDAFFDEDEPDYWKGLIYGRGGVGKTIAGGSLFNSILYLAVDPGGSSSFRNHPELGWKTRIIPMRYKGLSQLEALADAFLERIDRFNQFDSLMVDTATNTGVLDLDLVTRERMKYKGKKGDTFDFMDDMLGVYNQNTFRLKAAYLKLMLAPVNIILIAHDRVFDDKDETGYKLIQPKFTPEVYKTIEGYCTQVIRMTAARQKGSDDSATPVYTRKMQFHPSGNIVAKSRIGGLPTIQENPDLKLILDKWQKEGTPTEPLDPKKIEEQKMELASFGLGN